MHRMTRHGVFLVPVLDRWLAFAPLHGVAAVVNAAAARDLRRGAAVLSNGALADLGRVLRRVPSNAPCPPDGEACPPLLGIIPTRGCNLACAYCDFGGSSSAHTTMAPSTAVAAVDWMAQRMRDAGRRNYRVHFFGGEPFLAPEIVAIVVHRVRLLADRHGLAPYVDGSTSGVIDAGVCEFIGDYFSGIAVSLDGPPEIHNRLRPRSGGQPTFDHVNRTVARLSEMPVELCLRACITEDSVEELEHVVRWMIDTYRPSAVNIETLTPGVASRRAGLKAPDPYRFAARCVSAYKVADDTGVPVVYSAAERERARLSFCPVGTDAVIVSPDGRVSACYLRPEDWRSRGLDLDVGGIDTEGTVVIDRGALGRVRELPLLKPRCARCFCQWTCAGGCHINETYPGCAVDYTPFCVQTRIVTACLLLRDAGCGEVADALVSDQRAMERLACHWWDPFDSIGDENVPVTGEASPVWPRGGEPRRAQSGSPP